MGNLAVKPSIPNPGADRFYDQFSQSFQAMKSEVDDYMDILRVLSTQLQYVPPEQETFHLSINGRPIGLALRAIANALIGDEHVAQLSLETTGIDTDTISILASVLTVNHTLKELYLTGNNLGPTGIRHLVDSLKGNTTLSTLHLGSTACGDEGCEFVAGLIGCGSTALRRINLSANGITDAGFTLLEDAVRNNEQVVELELRDNAAIAPAMLTSMSDLMKIRFKPYMEELRRDEAIREAARKSGVMETPKKSNRKGGFSIKARLQKVRSNVRSISATELRSDRRGSGRDKDSSSRESNSKESNSKESVSESAPVAAAEEANAVAADGEELSIFDFLRTVNPEDVPVPRSKRVVDGGSSPRLDGSSESRSAPSSPRLANKAIKDVIAGSKKRGMSVSDAEEVARVGGGKTTVPGGPLEDGRLILRLHIVEAARLKPVQKNGVSDPFCHAGAFLDARGKKIVTSTQRKTLSPQWHQWFDFVPESLADWTFELHLQDGKLAGDKGKLGHVVVASKDWDLSEQTGQEQWLDVVDGLGAVKVGMSASAAALPECRAISVKRKEAAQKERDAQTALVEQRSGRPRGRTMLAPPKAVLDKVAANVVHAPRTPTSKPVSVTVGVAETIGRRPSMEDAILVQGQLGGQRDRDLFAVFDGHGSEKVAVHCAEHIGAVLLRHLDAGKAPLEALRASFLDLSAEVAPWAINQGCTAVAALIIGRHVYVANCGDTRAVLCSGGGVAERLTLDHKPSLPDEIKRIEELGGFVRNGRVQGQLAVSRALGDANFAPYITPEPYLRSMEFSNDYTHLILACDGLWDVFPDSLAGQIVANQPEPSQAAVMLRDRAFASGSTDNISVLVVALAVPEPAKAPVAKELPRLTKSLTSLEATLKVIDVSPAVTDDDEESEDKEDDPFSNFDVQDGTRK